MSIIRYQDAGISSVAFSPDGNTLAVSDGYPPPSGGRHGAIHLWRLADGRTTRTLHDPDGNPVIGVEYSPDGASLAAMSFRRIYLWDTASDTIVSTITPPAHAILRDFAIDPDGQAIAAVDANDTAYVWELGTGKLVAALRDPDGEEIDSLAYSPDGRTLAVSEYNGRIDLWNVSGL